MSDVNSASSSFTRIAKFNLDGIVKGNYYISNISKISVLIAEIDGPKINAYVTVGTRVDSHDGIAHTLEHLIYTGSKNYPYKGVLDFLANRCFAQGTNAWTSIDHTTYTISTASEEGLINILPVYMDHIVNPTLDDEDFASEVYSVNELGEESGVVFSEMQAKEFTEDSRIHIKTMKCMFDKESGYPFISGGKLDEIRNLKIEKVREYHEKYYRPENMLICIVGSVEENKILDVIKMIDNTILNRFINETKIQRVWANNKPNKIKYGVFSQKFSSENDKIGSLTVALEGPDRSNLTEVLAFNVIASYLSFFDNSPLRKPIGEDNYRPETIYYFIRFNKLYLILRFLNLPTIYFSDVIANFNMQMKNLINEDLNEECIKNVIHFEYNDSVNCFGIDPHEIICRKGIEYFLYGNTTLDLINSLEETNFYHDLMLKPMEFWKNLTKKYFIPDCYCFIIGEPVKDLCHDVKKLDKNEISIKVEKSKKDKSIPKNLLDKFPIPSLDNINFHNIKTLCNFGSFDFDDTMMYNFDISELPLAIQIDDIKSNELQVTLCICLGKVDSELIPYLPIASQLPLKMPICRNGVFLNKDEVTKQMELIFPSRECFIGWNSGIFDVGILSYYYFITLKTNIDHYEDAISWIKDLLFNNILNDLEIIDLIEDNYTYALKGCESGHIAVNSLSALITYRINTINYCQNVFYQCKWLKEIKNMVDNKNLSTICSNLAKIKTFLRTGSNIHAHLTCDFHKLSDICRSPHSIWELNFSHNAIYDSKTPRTPSHFNHTQLEKSTFYHKIIPLTSSKSSYLVQTTPSIDSYRDRDYPPLTVLLEYLSGFEGPLWKILRGNGLAYTSVAFCEPSDGLIYFKISKSPDIVKAYEESINLFKSLIRTSDKITQQSLESAISGVIFEIVNHECNICNAALQRMIAQLKGLNYDFNKDFIKKVTRVTLDKMRKIAQKYLASLVNTDKSHIAISCPKDQTDKIISGFKELGINLEIFDEESIQIKI